MLKWKIPTQQSYNVFTAQLIRYARGCQEVMDFHDRTKILVLRLLKQHFELSQLQRTYNKFLMKYASILVRYNTGLKKKLTDIISSS